MIGWRVFLWVVIVMAALGFLYAVRSILPPFIISIVICAILEPLIKRLRKMGLRPGTAKLVVVGAFFVVGLGTFFALAPAITNQVSVVKNKAQTFATSLTETNTNDNLFKRWNPVVVAQRTTNRDAIDRLLEANHDILDRFDLPSTKEGFLQQYVVPNRPKIDKTVRDSFGSFIGVASGLFSQVILLLFVPLITWLMLQDMEDFKRRAITWVPPSLRKTTQEIVGEIVGVFMGYLRGVTLAVGSYIALMGLVLTIAGVPYGLLLGMLVGIVYLIPLLNFPISASIILFVTGLSGSDKLLGIALPSPWIHAFVALGIFTAFHFVFDTIFYPKMVGSSVGLHPVVSFFVTLSGGALFGLVGMLFAFPLAGSVKVILDRLLHFTTRPSDDLNLPAVPVRHRTT